MKIIRFSTAFFLIAAAALNADTSKINISSDAQELLDKVSAAYSGLTSLQLTGTLSGNFDIAGEHKSESQAFTASYQSPNRFRHELQDDIAVGSTGEKVYAFAKTPNIFLSSDAPAGKVEDDLPKPIKHTLKEQNPSLLLALAKNPASQLEEDINQIVVSSPVTISGKSFDSLILSSTSDAPTIRVLVDPNTHLIRQVQTDLAPDLRHRGAPEVKSAVVTIDYTNTTTDTPIKDAVFAWVPPDGARQASGREMADDASSATALAGKPAPDFTLNGLDGKKVALKDLKGSVLILDFWATWCGPCVASLPHLDAVYKEFQPKGLKVYALNQQEESDTVQKFVDRTKLSVPILLDKAGDVGKQYGAEAIPETVIIGKDGIVKKVLVGYGDDTEATVKQTVEKLLKD